MSRGSSPPALAGFRYLEYLGKGGFADVYKYERLGRPVAVKVLLRRLGAGNQQTFEAEAHTMAQLSSHPNVVSIFDAGQTPSGDAFLVMEYCPPPHLGVQIRHARRPFPVARVLEVGVQLAGAVESAHRLGILHRDIKPANILFTEFQRPALTDFGIASSTLTGASGDSDAVSVPWAPPEQISGSTPFGPTGDVYALAATMWTMLVGHSPFERTDSSNDAVSIAHRARTQAPPPMRREDVSPSLVRVLGIAMAKQPSQRYQSAQEFARALQSVQAELHLSPTTFDVVAERPELVHFEPDQEPWASVTGFVSIDPDGTDTGQRSEGFHPTGTTGVRPPVDSAASLDGDGAGQPSAAQEPPEPGAPGPADPPGHPPAGPTRHEDSDPAVADHAAGGRRSRQLLVGAGAAVVLVLAGFAASKLGDGGPGTTPRSEDSTTEAVSDPVEGIVPPVTHVTLKRRGGKLRVSWTNPDPRPGDEYRVLPVGPTGTVVEATTTHADVPIAADGTTCVQVTLLRRSGTPSNPVEKCEKAQ
ncbi:MAG: serine/threonine-protein kinase [Tetrasphaera sp.]